MFSFKNHAENLAGRLVQTAFWFLKKLYMKLNQVVSTLVSISFGSPRIGHTVKMPV